MEVPLLARSVAAAVGGLLVLATGVSVVATLIVPRPVGGWLTSWAQPRRRQDVSVPDLGHCGLQATGSADGRRSRIDPHRSTDRLAGRVTWLGTRSCSGRSYRAASQRRSHSRARRCSPSGSRSRRAALPRSLSTSPPRPA